MDTRSLSPFRKKFPAEIHNEILKLCDSSTLANTSRVSLAFLELSSPLFYRDIKLVRFEQMGKLFCDRKSSQPLVEHHLSLHQIRTFTIVGPGRIDHLPSFSLDRSPSSRPLDVDELHAQFYGHSSFPLHLFNPSLASFKPAPSRRSAGHDSSQSIMFVCRSPYPPVKWPCLSKVVLRDCLLLCQGSSFQVPSLCISDTQVNELQIVFESYHLSFPSQIAGNGIEGEGRGAFQRLLLCGLSKLFVGSRAVKEVVIRTVVAGQKGIEREVSSMMGQEMVDGLKQEGKLRFEVLEEE